MEFRHCRLEIEALEELNNKGYQFVTLDTLQQYFELKSVIK